MNKQAQEDKAFIRGYACCMANMVSVEDWRPSQSTGGFTLDAFKAAGVDERDLEIITEAWNE
jgi:hypothetical protein